MGWRTPSMMARSGERDAGLSAVIRAPTLAPRSDAGTTRSTRLPARCTRTPGTPGAPGSHPSACNSRASPQVRAWRCCRPSVNVMVPGRVAKPKPTSPPVLRNAARSVNGVAARRAPPRSPAPRRGSACRPDFAASRTPARCATCCARSRRRRSVASSVARDADLAEMLLVRGHRGDGGALGRPAARTQSVEARRRSAHAVRRVRPGRRAGEAPPPALYSRVPTRIAARARPFAVSRTQPSSHPREAQLVGQVLHDVIRVEREGAVVTLTIDHPPANAVNGDVVNGLAEGLGELPRPTRPAARWSSPGADPSSSPPAPTSPGSAPAPKRSARRPTSRCCSRRRGSR